jgi:hypothetical protein
MARRRPSFCVPCEVTPRLRDSEQRLTLLSGHRPRDPLALDCVSLIGLGILHLAPIGGSPRSPDPENRIMELWFRHLAAS